MEISLQNIARPQAVPQAGLPLQYIDPRLLAPSDGIDATAAGLKIGQSAVAPLAAAGEYVGEYYRPQAVAEREARIAQAHLATTGATQENDAALSTPSLPLAQRTLQLNQATAGNELVQPQKNYALANLASETEVLPSKTQAALAGNTQAAQSAANAVNSTPNIYPPGAPVTQEELSRNAGARSNALSNAKFGREVAIAGNPYLSTDGNSVSVPEGKYISGGKVMEDTVISRQVQGEDGRVYNQNVWSHTGKPVSYLPDTLSGSNARTEAADARQDKTISSRSVNIGTKDDPIILEPGTATFTKGVIADFKNSEDVKAIVKISPLVDRALSQIEASKNAKTGVIDIDAMLTAARAMRGTVTDQEVKALDAAGGLNNAWYRIQNIINGKKYDPETMKKDLQSSLIAIKSEGNAYLNNTVYPAFQQNLPAEAQDKAQSLFGRVAHIGQQSEGQAPTAATSSVPAASQDTANLPKPTTPQEANSLPSGTRYVDPYGNIRQRP